MFFHGRHITTSIYRLSPMSRTWQRSSLALQCINTDGVNRRTYSGLSKPRSGLQLQKCASSPLYLAESKRYIEYNIFYLLVHALEYQFVTVKSISGLNWCATILCCTMIYRLPLMLHLKKKNIAMKYEHKRIYEEELKPLSKKEIKTMRKEHPHLNVQEREKMIDYKMKFHRKRLYKEHKVNPFDMIVYSLSPMPFWLANSWALRNLSGAYVPLMSEVGPLCPEMQDGGMLWFQNLCVADPYHILPCLIGLSYLLSMEVNLLADVHYGMKPGITGLLRLEKIFNRFTYLWCFFATYLFWNLPAAMTWYWVSSGFCVLIVKIVLLHPEIEKYFAPANVHQDINDNPYKTILTNMSKRYNPKNWFLPK